MLQLIQETDFRILDWIQQNLRSGLLDWLMPKITFLCDAGWFWILLTLVFLISKTYRRRGITLFCGLAMCGLFGNLLLKNIVARDRPCWIRPLNDMLVSIPGDYSFPSGHSMVSFACAVILFHYDRRIGIPALFLAGAIALSRLYVYVHFPTDVLLGTLIGILIGIAAVRSANRFFTVADRKK